VGEGDGAPYQHRVAGSFGKSTCTGLMAHVLREAGRGAGWMIGPFSPSLPATGAWGRAAELVLEGDEYILSDDDRRSKFELYHPRDVLLTSLVHDHVNVFPTFADYEAPFRRLLRGLPAQGLVVMRDHPAIRAVAAETRAPDRLWDDTAPCDGWFCEDVAMGRPPGSSWWGREGGGSRSPPPCWASTTSRMSSASRPSCWSGAC